MLWVWRYFREEYLPKSPVWAGIITLVIVAVLAQRVWCACNLWEFLTRKRTFFFKAPHFRKPR